MVATTVKEGLVVGMRSMPGKPYDGHTLAETLQQERILADARSMIVIDDKDYRGVYNGGVCTLRSGQKRGLTRILQAMFRRRSAIEPTVRHM